MSFTDPSTVLTFAASVGVAFQYLRDTTAWAKLEEVDQWLEKVDKLLRSLPREQVDRINAASPNTLDNLIRDYQVICKQRETFRQQYLQAGWLERQNHWGHIHEEALDLHKASQGLHLDVLKTTKQSAIFSPVHATENNAPYPDPPIKGVVEEIKAMMTSAPVVEEMVAACDSVMKELLVAGDETTASVTEASQ
ncbi:hypothetical protein FA95DRAFT_1611372 [Auriscalpium vulgare]|uniref:Uncharacterized protein n=1 Tax=Auriscalpium vulgare TaxID=40419 RepID=A0ACB8RA81_9AGAM|nr:hypothetical protein FA95DRAFT_1611372 [Auriscalpium vulgare]